MRPFLIVVLLAAPALAHSGGRPAVDFQFADLQLADADGAFANPPAPDPEVSAAMKEEAQTESTFLKFIGALLAALIPVIGVMVKKWAAKVDAEKDATTLNTGIGIALHLVDAFLSEASRELLPKLREALADGILSDSERADLRKAVLALLTSKLPGDVLSVLSKSFGPGLQSWLDRQADVAIDRAAKDAVVPR